MHIMRSFSTLIPLYGTLKSYKTENLKGDLSAGLTVGVMLIPQGMAYAMIAGLPPIYGLYASTLPLLIYALLGSSRHLAVGPVAMVSLLTASGIGALAEGGTETYIALAIALAFFVGLIQFLLGLFRMGFLVNFLSHPVISGFTSAAALIIGISQLKHLLGFEIPRTHYVHESLIYAIRHIGETDILTLAIGLGGVAMIMGLKRWKKSLPGALIAVVIGILLVSGFDLDQNGVQIVGSVPEGLPSVIIPHINLGTATQLMPIALAIALVSFMESIAVAKAVQAKHKNYEVDANQELIALGAANIGGSFAQSYPVTGGFSRTAVNDQAGANTSIASIVSALLIVLTLLFFTPLFYNLPNAILASVIMVAVFGLIDYKETIHLWHSDRSDFWMLIITFLGTLTLGIELGIGLGVILSLVLLIYRTTRPHMAVLGKVPGTHFYRNKERFSDVECRDDMLIVRFDAELYYANVNFFRETLERLEQEKENTLRAVIVNAESINNMDSTAIRMLNELIDDHQSRGITLYFTGVIGPVRDALEKGDIMDKLGEPGLFMSVEEAVNAFDNPSAKKRHSEKFKEYTTQSNA